MAFLFPGQGSQVVGMGRALAEAFPVARDTFAEADAVLDAPLSQLLFEGPAAELTATRNAQPGLLAHGVAAARVLAERDIRPAAVAGHSLGEFTALVAAGAIGFADALRTVRLRGDLMGAAGADRLGAMTAVLGLAEDAVAAICEAASTTESVVVAANVNAADQVVISGDAAAVARAGALARERGARRVVPLTVSGAFHSPLMAPAAEGLRRAIAEVPVADARVPVVANVTGRPVQEAAEIRRLLVAQLTRPVRWHASMLSLVELGFTDFVECGPGKVLAGLAKRVPGVRSARVVGEPADVDGWRTPGDGARSAAAAGAEGAGAERPAPAAGLP